MRTLSPFWFAAVLTIASLLPLSMRSQWTPLLAHPLLQNPTTGATVGLGPGASAFNVFGQQMTPPTTEVFRTDAPLPNNTATYWRMFHGGAEYGNFFHFDHDLKFNVNARQGHLVFLTNDRERMRINPGFTIPTWNNFNNIVTDGFVGICPTTSLWTSGPGPLSRLHLADGVNDNSPQGFRDWQRNGITFTGNLD